MKIFLSIIISLTLLVPGLFSQLGFVINPDGHNGIELNTDGVPTPDENYSEYRIQLSEINMRYRVYGENSEKPALILIHGNGGNCSSLSSAASYLANDYTVYVTESRCHGETTQTEELSYTLIAKDIAEFIKAKELEKPIIMGHSDGGIVAITIASDYPDIPGAIISCGANSSPAGLKITNLLSYAWRHTFTRNKLITMMVEGPDFTKEYLSKITCPAYIVSGQNDIVFVSDTEYIAKNIAGADYAIVKGGTHSSYTEGKQAYALATQWLRSQGM